MTGVATQAEVDAFLSDSAPPSPSKQKKERPVSQDEINAFLKAPAPTKRSSEVSQDEIDSFLSSPQTPPQQTFLQKTGDFGKSVLRGGLSIGEDVGGVLGAVGFRKAGEALTSGTKAVEDKYLAVQDPTTLANQIAAGFGSAATFFIPGLGVDKAALKIAGAAPRIAKWLGIGTAAVLQAGSSAGSVYNEAMARNPNDPDAASKVALGDFVANLPADVILSKWALTKSPAGKAFSNTLKGVSIGSAQAGIQQVIQNVALQDPTWSGVPQAAAIGGIVGGGIGAVHAVAEKFGKKEGIDNAEPQATPQAGIQQPDNQPAVQADANQPTASANPATGQGQAGANDQGIVSKGKTPERLDPATVDKSHIEKMQEMAIDGLPDYLQNTGVKPAENLNILNKLMADKPLTDKQSTKFQTIYESFLSKSPKAASEYLNPENLGKIKGLIDGSFTPEELDLLNQHKDKLGKQVLQTLPDGTKITGQDVLNVFTKISNSKPTEALPLSNTGLQSPEVRPLGPGEGEGNRAPVNQNPAIPPLGPGAKETLGQNGNAPDFAQAKTQGPFPGGETPASTPKPGTLPGTPVEQFVKQDVIPKAQAVFASGKKAMDYFKILVAPSTVSKESAQTANMTRQELGKMEYARAQAEEALKSARAFFLTKPAQFNYDFIHAVETGKTLHDPDLNTFAQTIRKLLDDDLAQLQKTGRLKDYIENYFPHMWGDTKKAKGIFSKGPLAGTKFFTKQRTIPLLKEGLERGLKPVSDNPVDMVLMRLHDSQKLLMADRLFKENLKGSGLVKFVGLGKDVPEGWIKVKDPIGKVYQYSEKEKGLIHRGDYYMPQDAARILNNYLSPGLQGNPLYEALRQSGNALNQLQLGLSGFHATFTSLDAAVSKASLGIQKMATPGFRAEGVKDFALGAVPGLNVYTPIANVVKGDKLYKAYLSPEFLQSRPELKPFVQALIDANGRVKQDKFYYNNAIDNMKQAWGNKNPVGAVLRSPMAAVEYAAKPIMEYLVPRQKLGVFMDQADFIYRQAEKGQIKPEDVTKRLQEAWDSVDNRMGQLVYDNLFWNKVQKDTLMVSTRSLGWNLGTVREIGGGVLDIRKVFTEGRVSPRMAYIMALPAVVGLMGGLMTFIATGKRPETMKDLFFPRSGRILDDGNPERLSLPSYLKDLYGYKHNTIGTISNKIHPLPSMLLDMINNRDFYGVEIHNDNDRFLLRRLQDLQYMGKQLVPFSIRNVMEFLKTGKGIGGIIAGEAGILPAPKYITNTPIQNEIVGAYNRRFGGGTRTLAEAAESQTKSEIRKAKKAGEDTSELRHKAIHDEALTGKQVGSLMRSINKSPYIRMFNRLPEEDQVRIIKLMSPEEKNLFNSKRVMNKYANKNKVSGG